ncbi:hypothetical protein ACGFZQ_27840 [Streptomyces sp. NPDC048254]|uniref:hypothetical protein n=1 Tax=Streptomyces sp. NPDC048254 TaxID=3365525 RepID=UPI00371C471F
MTVLKPGGRYRSQVCDTEVIVIRAPSADSDLCCGGTPMVRLEDGATPASDSGPAEGWDGGSLLGKRYADTDGTLEVLVTKPGGGSLGVGGTPLEVKRAKPLPASD